VATRPKQDEKKSQQFENLKIYIIRNFVFVFETLEDNLNLKDNLKLIKLGGHHIVKTLVLISPKILKKNIQYKKIFLWKPKQAL
jgi:hypothetical protein